MEPNRLCCLNSVFKWAISVYLLLTVMGFGVAALISHQRYDLSHEKTQVYYLGDEAQMAYPKLYVQLISTAHVHSFTMPLVFLAVWVGLVFLPIQGISKKILILGGGFSILIYNSAPFLLRYHSPRWVSLFTVGGIGLFLFYLIPASLILYETWVGFSPRHDK